MTPKIIEIWESTLQYRTSTGAVRYCFIGFEELPEYALQQLQVAPNNEDYFPDRIIAAIHWLLDEEDGTQ